MVVMHLEQAAMEPQSIPALVMQNLPSTSDFFIHYIILDTFVHSSLYLLQSENVPSPEDGQDLEL